MVCHHVLHNVVDLPPFLAALHAAVRDGAGGVVVEMLPEHPMAWLDPLSMNRSMAGVAAPAQYSHAA